MGSRASRALICEGGQMFPSGLYYIFFCVSSLLKNQHGRVRGRVPKNGAHTGHTGAVKQTEDKTA